MPPSDPLTDSDSQSPPTRDDSAAPSASRPRRFLPRSVWAGLIVVGVILGLVVVLEVFVARRIPELTETRLDQAERRWEEHGPASYDLDLVIKGAQPGTVHVEVRDGAVTAMTRDGRSPSQRRTWFVWSVPGQFEMIERELEMAADPEYEMQAAAGVELWLRAEFDSKYGYPRQFHRVVIGGGPEVYWRVTKFQPQ